MKVRHKLVLLGASLATATAIFLVGCDNRQKGTGAPAPGTTIGTTVDDDIITTKIKSGLLADPDVKSFDIHVETRKGEVQLSGFANNQTQIDRALEIARTVAGVTSVENKMSVKE